MRKLSIIAFAVLTAPMAGCATPLLTPERCETLLQAADTVQAIAAVLIERGIEPERAANIANAVAQGQIALSVACAAI